MSVRTELEELVEWISDLSAKPEPEPTPEPLLQDAWKNVKERLEYASKTFGEASDALLVLADGAVALERKQRASSLAEFARDLKREAEGLSFRASVLFRRAPLTRKPEPEGTTVPELKTKLIEVQTELDETNVKLIEVQTELDETKDKLKTETDTLKETTAQLAATRAELEKAVPGATARAPEGAKPKEKRKKPPRTSADLVRSAGGSIETARENFDAVEHPDVVSKAFEEELDVLAEMALSLRQQCDSLEEA